MIQSLTAIAWLVSWYWHLVLVESLLVLHIVFPVAFIVGHGFQLSARLLRLLLSQPSFDIVEEAVVIVDLNGRSVVLVKILVYVIIQLSPCCVTTKNEGPAGDLKKSDDVSKWFVITCNFERTYKDSNVDTKKAECKLRDRYTVPLPVTTLTCPSNDALGAVRQAQ